MYSRCRAARSLSCVGWLASFVKAWSCHLLHPLGAIDRLRPVSPTDGDAISIVAAPTPNLHGGELDFSRPSNSFVFWRKRRRRSTSGNSVHLLVVQKTSQDKLRDDPKGQIDSWFAGPTSLWYLMFPTMLRGTLH
jgi:hypothetical protein